MIVENREKSAAWNFTKCAVKDFGRDVEGWILAYVNYIDTVLVLVYFAGFS